jgi:hypothetical protein
MKGALDVARHSTLWRLEREGRLEEARQYDDVRHLILNHNPVDPQQAELQVALGQGGQWLPVQVEVNTTSDWTSVYWPFGMMGMTQRRITCGTLDDIDPKAGGLGIGRTGTALLTLRAEMWLKVLEGELDVEIRKGSWGATSVRVWSLGRVLHSMNRFHNHVRRQLVRAWKRRWREGVVSRHPIASLEVPDEMYDASGAEWAVRAANAAAHRERRQRRAAPGHR